VSESKPAVSVVVTCFNYGRYVAGCLESVVAQTFDDFEIVVVDDGSTDDSAEIIRRYTADPRIRLIQQANGGQAKAKNVGVRASNGEFVAFLDADDEWEPDKIRRQMPLFADPAVGVVFSRMRCIDPQGTPIVLPPPVREMTPRRGRVTSHLFIDNFVPFSSSVVRRAAFGAKAPFDETLPMGIDWDLWLRLSVVHSFDFIDAPLLRYRLGHPDQMSRQSEVRQTCSDRIMRRFVETYPTAISRSTINKGWAYTHRSRGLYYFQEDPSSTGVDCA
jgi:glycosyltransferase involved in cell wall biosynthesis